MAASDDDRTISHATNDNVTDRNIAILAVSSSPQSVIHNPGHVMMSEREPPLIQQSKDNAILPASVCYGRSMEHGSEEAPQRNVRHGAVKCRRREPFVGGTTPSDLSGNNLQHERRQGRRRVTDRVGGQQ